MLRGRYGLLWVLFLRRRKGFYVRMYVMYVWDGVYYGFGGVGWGVDCVVLYTVYILWFEWIAIPPFCNILRLYF